MFLYRKPHLFLMRRFSTSLKGLPSGQTVGTMSSLVEPKACLHKTRGWVKKKKKGKEEDNKIIHVCQNLVFHRIGLLDLIAV